MGFSIEWENIYKDQRHLSIWPWSDLISYVMRYANPSEKKLNVLEIGCGAGANIPFFLQTGCNYYAIEGSQYIVKNIIKKYPELTDKIIISDFTKDICFNISFDLVIDRASLTHNDTQAIKKTIQNLYTKLNINGKYIGIDWFSKNHSDALKGDYVDEFTRTNISEGHLKGLGKVHFSDEYHIKEIFKDYEILIMEEKIIKRIILQSNYQFASWNFVAQKKK